MKVALQIVIAALALVGAYSLIVGFLSSSLHQVNQETWAAMETSDFSCPVGTEESREGWGKNGYMRYCEPLLDGPWEAWETGYRNILGAHRAGKKHGQWKHFDADASVRLIIEYEDGVELSREPVEE